MGSWAKILLRVLKIAEVFAKAMQKTPMEKRKEAMNELDEALVKARDPKEPSTEALEKWFNERS